MNLHLRLRRGAHSDPRHRIADEQTIKDRADDLRLLRRRDLRHAPPLHTLRRDCRNRALHTRTHHGRNPLIAHDNSRSLLHAGGRCGIDGGIQPQNCEKEKRERTGAHKAMRHIHQNVPPTRKCTRPPCEPRP